MLDTIVQNTFRKALKEKEYCIFYGDLCEKMMRLELELMDQDRKIGNMKNSVFRKALLESSRDTFEKFFSQEDKDKKERDPEG